MSPPGPAPARPTALRAAFRECRGAFSALVVFSLCVNLLTLTVPLYMLQMFDRVLASRSGDTLLMLSLIAVVALLTLSALDLVRGFLLARTSIWLDRRVGGPLLAAAVDRRLKAGAEPSAEGLRDLNTVRTFIGGSGMFPILDAPWSPIFLAAIFLLHPLLGWIAAGGAVAIFALAFTNEVVTREPLRLASQANLRALVGAESATRNADAIQAMGMLPAVLARWRRANDETLDMQATVSARSGLLTAASRFLRLVLQIGILGAGAWLIMRSELTAGAMIAASILMGRCLAPVERAIGTWRGAVGARQAYGRVVEQLRSAPPPDATMPLPAPRGHLRLESVTFVHPGAEKPAVRGVSLELGPGKVLGLIGPSAAGKTTLGRLLVGNLVPRAGHVRLDGMEISQWNPDDRGRHVGYLPQDVGLFAGTVAENIARMGEPESEAVVEAARRARAHVVVVRLPKGYDTPIGEGGAGLSGGQRQRIGLARALFGDPRFVMLDEPGSSLDNEGTEALIAAIGDLKARGVTVVIIAHQPSVMRLADYLVVLREGRIEMAGERDEIMARVTGPEPQGRGRREKDGERA